MLLAWLIFCCHSVSRGQPSPASSIVPVQLRTAALASPFGLDILQPDFSWQLRATSPGARGLRQTAYRVVVASSALRLEQDRGETWDSKRVASSAQVGIECACASLKPNADYFWKVMTWDQQRRPSSWSTPAQWHTGMLGASAWQAKWIAAAADGPTPSPTREGVDLPLPAPSPLPLFRREFTLQQSVASATVAVSGLGQYALRINGQPVTASVMNPAWSNYRKRVFYNLYDVTALLRPGKNTVGILLGNGMYNVPHVAGRYSKFTGSFGQPKAILQLMIRLKDDSVTTIVTDSSWTTAPGPLTFSSIYGGEDYDARLEPDSWDQPNFKQPGWQPAIEVAGPGGALVAQLVRPLILAETLTPVRSRRFADGSTVYDLGKNFSGWPNITVRGDAGSRVKLLTGELLDGEGHVTQASMAARPGFEVAFSYTLRGGAPETWHPQFSYTGFRYVEVQPVADGPMKSTAPVVLSLSGSFLHEDVRSSGHFTTSNQLDEKIHALINQAILSNMVSVLTDCPTREKLGWLEQTHLAATSILYNYDVQALYGKIADDMADAQTGDGLVPSIAPEYVAFVDKAGQGTAFRDSPEWGSAIILSPLAAYRFYGDSDILSSHYGAMQSYLAYLQARSSNGMIAYGLGDWYDIGPAEPGPSQLTGESLTATAIYYQDLTAMILIALLLDRPDDGERYAGLAAQIKAAFNRELFHSATAEYDRGSQTANAMPLALGLVPEDRREAVLDNLVRDIHAHGDHITAGDIGFHYVVRALTDGGRSDVLAAMLARTDSPSYGYQIERGATALTEAWDSNPSDSQNHFMLGHAEEWFYRGLAGLDLDLTRSEPERIRIKPALVENVDSADASLDSVFGQVRSSWVRSAEGVSFTITVPPGQQAAVTLPLTLSARISEGGSPLVFGGAVKLVKRSPDAIELTVGSGTFLFRVSQ